MSKDEVTISRMEYDELIQDSHSLELIFNILKMKSYIDDDNRFSIVIDQDFINMIKAIDPEQIDELENFKREESLKIQEIIEKEEKNSKKVQKEQINKPRNKKR